MKIVPSVLTVFCLMVMFVALPVQAQAPTLPHAFFGAVEIAGAPAPANTQIEARGTGILTGVPGNPLYTTEAGQYGGPTAFASKLVVQGTVAQGATVEFFINGVKAQCAVAGGAWQDSIPFAAGAITQLNLKIDQAAPAPATPTVTATLPPTATMTRPPTAAPTATQVGGPIAAPTATRNPSAPTLMPAAGSTVPPTIASTVTAAAVQPTAGLTAGVTTPTGQPASGTATPAAIAAATVILPTETVAPTATPALAQPAATTTASIVRATSAPILSRDATSPTSAPANGASTAQPASSGVLLGLGMLALVAAITVGAVIWLRRGGRA